MTATIVLGPRPPELEAFLERRRRLGQDGRDEVWEGRYVVAPFARAGHGVLQSELLDVLRQSARRQGLVATAGCNLGKKDDFRVPDAALHERVPSSLVYLETARLVVEVLSPDDETFAKLDFYAARRVVELLVVDGAARSVRCFALQDGQRERDRSEVLGLTTAEVEAQVDWPDD